MPRPDRHREPLLAAAATSLRRRGYAATSVSDVLREAGATNGSLYHHFPGGKADIARAALTASADQVDGLLAGALARASDPATAVQGWIDSLVRALRHDGRDGCPVATAAVELAGVEEGLRELAAAAFARWTATLAAALDGDEATARVVLSAIEGALMLDRTARGTANLEALRPAVPRLLAAS